MYFNIRNSEEGSKPTNTAQNENVAERKAEDKWIHRGNKEKRNKNEKCAPEDYYSSMYIGRESIFSQPAFAFKHLHRRTTDFLA